MTNYHLDWCIREQYLDLVENYLKGKIDTNEFCFTFDSIGLVTFEIIHMLESNLIMLENNLIIFSPNEKSLGFSALLTQIFDLCSDYIVIEPEQRGENYNIELKNSVEEIYLKIQNFLKEE